MADTAPLPVSPDAAAPRKLDDLMLAMDVVDTLRHNDAIAAKELAQDERDHELRQRLREIYASQGIEVPDAVVEEGIKALRESRFTYTPAPDGFKRRLATWWVKRGVVGKWAAAVLAAIGISFGGYQLGVVMPRENAIEAARIELAQTLPRALNAAKVAVDREAQEDEARRLANVAFDDARAALNRQDAAGARKALASLQALETRLRESYSLRIVTSQGERSGVFRIPNVNTQARNYYLVVEAVGPDGLPLNRTITSEETGKSKTVARWGVRVTQDIYDNVRRDKQDDGIIQHNRVGEKRRGKLNPDYVMPVLGGAITEW